MQTASRVCLSTIALSLMVGVAITQCARIQGPKLILVRAMRGTTRYHRMKASVHQSQVSPLIYLSSY